MKTKLAPFAILTVFLFTVSIQAQWTDNGADITTLDKVGIGTGSIGITGTGVNTLVIGNGISSQGLVVNAGSANDAILSFSSNNTLVSRFIYNNPTGSLHYFKSGGLGNLFTVDSTGNFGIGTSGPSRKLHVVGGAFAVSHSSNQRLEISQDMNSNGTAIFDNQASIGDIKFQMSGSDKFIIQRSGNVGIGTTTPTSKLDIKVASNETMSNVNFLDGNYRIGSIGRASSTDGIGLFVSGYTEASVSTAMPTLVLKAYAKDFVPDNDYDAAVSVRGYNVDDDSELQNTPIFKVLNGHSVAHLTVAASGNVGIGTVSPDSKLAVNGTIHTKEVKVDLTGWSDFVFEKDYDLPTLSELERFILKNKHLPEIPSEVEVMANGILLGEMNAKLLQKIEELTLYLIEQDKKIEVLQKEVNTLKED